MIAASEPLEFIPRGRQTIEEHPGSIERKQYPHVPQEHVLLHRMQNVNISETEEEYTEFWGVREIFFDLNEYSQANGRINTPSTMGAKPTAQADTDPNLKMESDLEYMTHYLVNSEEELYVKKNIAVWTRGLGTQKREHPRMCFTCESPIKFAFFFDKFSSLEKTKSTQRIGKTRHTNTAICLIDKNSLRVYCSNGEDFLMNLEFPVSHVWPNCYGLLLEKTASSTILQNHTISMPRLFSLSHPLDEICPVLNKSATNVVTYLTDADYVIIYSEENSDLMLLYDSKLCKHFVARLRKVTEDEIHIVGAHQDTAYSGSAHHQSIPRGSFSHNSTKFGTATGKNTSIPFMGRTSLGNSNYTTHISKFLASAHSNSGICRNSTASPLSNLQSTLGQHSFSSQDIRKVGQAQPPKPIVPDLCLEHIWSENTYGSNREANEIATDAFLHTDLVGQRFFCYILPRSMKLQLVRMSNYGNNDLQLSSKINTISAKSAIPLKRLKMLATLDPSGNLFVYTGTTMISKILVSAANIPTIVGGQSTMSAALGRSPLSPFPRRSSLLPTVPKQTETNAFDEELHLLSPVQPLHPQFGQRNVSNICMSLRDPAGNRLTLVYPNGKMYRIGLPALHETILVSRCVNALRQVLKREQFLTFITRWYTVRNPPGSREYSIEQEWNLFKNALATLMGFEVYTREDVLASGAPLNAGEAKKRRKNIEITEGTDEDWEFMLSVLEGGTRPLSQRDKLTTKYSSSIDTNATLFDIVPAIFYCLHLLYEDLKLDKLLLNNLPYLANFLHQLAIDMQLSSYTFHYGLDFPHLLLRTEKLCLLTEKHGSQMQHKELLQIPAPGFYQQVEHILKGRAVLQYPHVEGVNDLSRNVLQVISVIIHGHKKIKEWIKVLDFPESVQWYFAKSKNRCISVNIPRSEQVIQMLINMNLTRKDIEHLPAAINLIISECLESSRLNPPIGRSQATYELILRPELVEHAQLQDDDFKPFQRPGVEAEDSLSPRIPLSKSGLANTDTLREDGMDNIDTKLLSLRYPEDLRIAEVRRLFNSSDPVIIDVVQTPGISDHEYIEEQEKQLLALCTRTMTLPMGRGMFTLRTSIPAPTESMPIPKLCLTGKEATKGATIELQQIEFPANMNLWPSFHNGVAAGLKISPKARDVDSTWIVYNKPKGQTETTEHAGFLMALGLNGHLKTLSFMSIYDYLVKCDEMTSVGLLLGIAATHRGTMDNSTTKLLSVHIEALLPATALELDIPQNIQVTCLMGIGLLYQGTAKRHIAEVLVEEIGRPPGPEMENSVERESYALTAGLALGLVTLGQGESPPGLRDLQLPDTLHYYIVGGRKRELSAAQKEKYKLPSFQVREGGNVNLDVTGPGATLALGLMFFQTNNQAVAQWMNPPTTKYLLDLVRPDLLMLRTIARSLIMWSDVSPSEEWLFNQFPANLRFDTNGNMQNMDMNEVDHESVTQAYCNIVAGAAFTMGLKYAGTEDPTAYETLYKTIKLFLSFPDGYVGEHAGRTTVENCMMLIVLAISLVFAGSGNLGILRLLRFLRSRIGRQHPHVNYGSHMVIHMSLGLLFLGAGRFTISKKPEAVAALVCAFFPKFPSHSNDNRYHLQAFRHLYVLAIEPRLFLPRDIDTRKLCLCQISVLDVGSSELRRLSMAPCMLPDLNTLQKVVVDDPNYWPVSFEKDRNWEQLVKALDNSACIDIKKRSGCLSHLDDPNGLKTLFAQTFTRDEHICWDTTPRELERFSNDPELMAFVDHYLDDNGEEQKEEDCIRKRHLTLLYYNAVVKDKMHVFPVYFDIFYHMEHAQKEPTFDDIWQMKLLDTYTKRCIEKPQMFSKELVRCHVQRFYHLLERNIAKFAHNLRRFLSKPLADVNHISKITDEQRAHIVSVITFYDLKPNMLNMVDLSGEVNYWRYLYEFRKINTETLTIFAMVNIINATETSNVSDV